MTNFDFTRQLVRILQSLASGTDPVLGDAAQHVEEVQVPAGGVITREAVPAGRMYVVVGGRAAVTVRGSAVGSIGPGEFIGEMALLEHNPRSATVTAVTPMRLLAIDPGDFGLLLREPTVLRLVATQLARRLRALSGAPSYDGDNDPWATLSPTERRCAELASNGRTNREIGHELSISRHTVDTHLRRAFAKLGITSRVELARTAGARATRQASTGVADDTPGTTDVTRSRDGQTARSPS